MRGGWAMARYFISIVAVTMAAWFPQGGALAGDADVDCNNVETQYALNICSLREFEHADAELNATYKKIFSKLHDNEKALFQNSERAWIKFRDAECGFQGS